MTPRIGSLPQSRCVAAIERPEMTRARRVQGAAGSHPVARPQVEMGVQKQPSSNDAPSSGNLDTPSPDPIGPPDNVDPVPGPWSHRPLVATLCVPSLTVRTSAPPDAAIDPVGACSTTPKVLASMPNPRVRKRYANVVGALTHHLSHCRLGEGQDTLRRRLKGRRPPAQRGSPS